MRKGLLGCILGGAALGSVHLGCGSSESPTSTSSGSSSSGHSSSAASSGGGGAGGAGVGGSTGAGGSPGVLKRVFVTTATFNGDLKTQGAGSDGVNGADLLCAAAAAKENLGGTWVAWVSSSTINAITRLSSGGRWTLIDKTTEVFPSRFDIQFGPKHAIDMTEAGASLLPPGGVGPKVWTNTTSIGQNSSDGLNNACNDWTDQIGVAAVGVIYDPKLGGGPGLSWTDTKQPQGCGGTFHLYCFEP